MKNSLDNRENRALICGISGQDGAYLARHLLRNGYIVHGTSRNPSKTPLSGMMALGVHESVKVHSMNTLSKESVASVIKAVKPTEIYNLSGLSSVALSFENPVEAIESICVGTLYILDAIRNIDPQIRLYNAGSSECFGDTNGFLATEETGFKPRSPYAVAKSAAFWEIANYREAYNLFACTGILFNHESALRLERFVTAKIIAAAKRIASGSNEKLRLGNINIIRDWGWSGEYVEAMNLMLKMDSPTDLVIATGESNTLESLVSEAFGNFGLDWQEHVLFDNALLRPSELMESHADPSRAAALLGWKARFKMKDVVKKMLNNEH